MKKSIEQIQKEIHNRDVYNRWIEKEGLYTTPSLSNNNGPITQNRSITECLQFGACLGLVAGFAGMFFELGTVCFIVGTAVGSVGVYLLNDK